jgi:hypothetical protein
MDTNPYAPPKAVVADIAPRQDSPPLWNPNAAANWSLLLTPAFGAFLHMKNWEELGEPDKAAAAKTWVIAVVSILVALPLAIVLVPGLRGSQNVSSLVGLVLLITWYVSSGRGQIRYVKERFGKDYPRRGWGRPLFMAALAVIAYVVVVGILAAMLAPLVGIAGS